MELGDLRCKNVRREPATLIVPYLCWPIIRGRTDARSPEGYRRNAYVFYYARDSCAAKSQRTRIYDARTLRLLEMKDHRTHLCVPYVLALQFSQRTRIINKLMMRVRCEFEE